MFRVVLKQWCRAPSLYPCLLVEALAVAGSFLFALYLVAESTWMIILQDIWLGSACSAAMWVVPAVFVWRT